MSRDENISIIVGVINEEENILLFLDELDKTLSKRNDNRIDELVIVDDGSIDETIPRIKANLTGHPYSISLFERTRKKGRVDADIFGSSKAKNEVVIVMDCDLQHPVEYIPLLVEIFDQDYDMVVASRYIRNGGSDWPPLRGILSRGGVFLSYLFVPSSRGIRDPMSGYFLVRRKLLSMLTPYNNSYKSVLYIVSRHPGIKIGEIPFIMKSRNRGESKIVGRNFNFFKNFIVELIRYRKITDKVK